jgi:tryptophan-rich sensory protein
MNGAGKWLALLVCVAAVSVAAVVGSAFMRAGDLAWYDSLRKPAWQPPDWLFGPVWTVLYVSMAASAWVFWLHVPREGRTVGLIVFGMQLALNAAWTGVFFYLQAPGAALVEIFALWCAVAATMAIFAGRSALAAALLLPYWGWVTFAAALNFAIWRINA